MRWRRTAVAGDDELTIEYLDDDPPAGEPVEDTPAGGRLRRRGRVLWALRGVGALLVVAGVTGVLIAPAPVAPAHVVEPVPTGLAETRLQQFGLAGAVAGSLARDPAEIAAVRARAVELFTDTGGLAVAPKDVFVLWAGDLDGHRYALTLMPHFNGGYIAVLLSGPAGTRAKGLSLTWNQDPTQSNTPGTPFAVFVRPPSGPRTAVAFVVAPKAPGVEIATGRQFLPGGRWTTQWRPLHQEGATWVSPIDPAEEFLATYRTPPGAMGTQAPSTGGPDLVGAAFAQATGPAANTPSGRVTVRCAADLAKLGGASLADRPVFVSTALQGRREHVAVVLLRSPENGWFWGMCDNLTSSEASYSSLGQSFAAGTVARPWTSPDQVMAAMTVSDGRYLVLAPAGADRVRVRGGRPAEVHDRLSIVTGPGTGELTFEALDEHSKVIEHLAFDPGLPPRTPN